MSMMLLLLLLMVMMKRLKLQLSTRTSRQSRGVDDAPQVSARRWITRRATPSVRRALPRWKRVFFVALSRVASLTSLISDVITGAQTASAAGAGSPLTGDGASHRPVNQSAKKVWPATLVSPPAPPVRLPLRFRSDSPLNVTFVDENWYLKIVVHENEGFHSLVHLFILFVQAASKQHAKIK